MSGMFLLFAVLGGCGSSEPSSPAGPAAKARKAPAKAKLAKAKLAKAKAARPTQQAAAPVGASGPVLGTLKLVATEGSAAKGAAGAPGAPAEGAVGAPGAPAGAPGAPAGAPAPEEASAEPAAPAAEPGTPDEAVAGQAAPGAKTQTAASLLLTYGEGGQTEVSLGRVDGTCTQLEPAPVGPEGKQQMPLWTVRCGVEGQQSDLYILQLGSNISVIREVPSSGEGVPTRYRPVKRVPLAKGAQLKRQS